MNVFERCLAGRGGTSLPYVYLRYEYMFISSFLVCFAITQITASHHFTVKYIVSE